MGRGALMVDWGALSHAYGSAEDVPVLLDVWVDAQNNDKPLNELWSRPCHQETVYSASFAAIRLLLELGAERGGRKCRDAVMLVGSILASKNAHGERPALASDIFRDLARLTESCFSHEGVDDGEFIYLMQAFGAARESRPWDSQFSRLVREEFEGRCEACNRWLLFAVGSQGYFAAAEDYVTKLDVARAAIAPADPDQLTEDDSWLEQVPLAHGRREVARKVLYLFGTTHCPVCNARLNVARAIDCLFRHDPHAS